MTESNAIAAIAQGNPYLCDTCPCAGPQTLERVLWEREHAADIETYWAASTSYSAGDLVAETFDDTTNERWYYRAKNAHTSTAADEPGVGANWTDEWEVTPLTLAECKAKLNALGPLYLSDNAYAGGVSAPAAHSGTYGNSAVNLTDALELAADLLSTLHTISSWDHHEREASVIPDSSDEADEWAAMDDAESDYGSASSSASTHVGVTWGKGFGWNGPNNHAYVFGHSMSGLTLERSHAGAFARTVTFWMLNAEITNSAFEYVTHGQSWLWAEGEYGEFSSETEPASTVDVVASNPATYAYTALGTSGTRPANTPPTNPRHARFELESPHAIAAWDFNAYPTGY